MSIEFKTLEAAKLEAKAIMNSGDVPNQPIWIIKDLRNDCYYVEIGEDVIIRNFEEVVETI